MYIKLTNGTPTTYTIGQLRKDNPNTSFPKNIPDELLAEFGVYPATVAEVPTFTDRTQTITQNETATQVNGAWVYGWTVVDKTAEEVTAYDIAKGVTVRSQRDELLASCDWMAIKAFEAGTGVATEWATYRQALRDVSAQAGFPNDITWPKKPE